MPYTTQAGAGSASSLTITYTGNLQEPIIIPVVPGLVIFPVGQTSAQSVATTTGKTAEQLFYFESSAGGGNRVLTLSFDDVEYCHQGTIVQSCAAMTSLSFPALIAAAGSFTPTALPALTTLSTPLLRYVGLNYSPSTMAALTTLSAPALETVGSIFGPTTMASVTTFNFPALARIANNFAPTTMGALTTISVPALTDVGAAFQATSMASLTTVSAPALVNIGGNITFTSGLGALTTVTGIGTVGTLKYVGGSTISFSGQALTQASVDHILALVASLDGTNGTTSWGTGKTLTLSGGTNATPSAGGLANKAIIQARGATVTNN